MVQKNKRYLSLILIVFCFCCESNAQIIKGRVLDYETDSAVAFANVYFNASLKGTITGIDGSFELNAEGFAGQDIVISCVGYESLTLGDYSPENTYKILLIPSVSMLDEIIVEPDNMPRKKKESIFLKEFLGFSTNAKKCKITNLKDLKLAYMKSQSMLLGFADAPLIIENKALGYKITYYLDEFRKDNKAMFYKGNFRFAVDSGKIGSAAIRDKRLSSYQGSRMHFIRTLYSERTDDDVFLVYNANSGDRLRYHEICCSDEGNGVKSFTTTDPLKIFYRSRESKIEFEPGNKVYIAENGYFDPQYIYWQGDMSYSRVGDLLPFEYQPVSKND